LRIRLWEQSGRKSEMAQEKLAESIFDSVVKRYDRFLRSVTFGLIDKWQKILVKNTPAGKFPVDVGTGTGEVVKKIKQEYADSLPIGVDVSLNMLKRAKEKNADSSSFFLKASAYKLPFKNNHISSIYASLVFRHLNGEEFIKEISRVLTKGGYVGILDISKPSKLLFNAMFFIANKIFRPLGERIFSKEEYDYFMESVINSKNPGELKDLFNRFGYKDIFIKSYFLGLVVIAVFRKE